MKSNIETEVRFLNIDKKLIIKKLQDLHALDKGEVLLSEVIFYDKQLSWKNENRLVRLRKNGSKNLLAYKQHAEQRIDGTIETEFSISDAESAYQFLEHIGLVAFRIQEKKRHTFELNNVTIDIDTWPKIPTYVELEGESEEELKSLARLLNLDWSTAIFEDARTVIEKYYNIPVGKLRVFTFEKIE